MPNVLIIGATGLVGRATLRQAIADARFGRIVAPTRRPLNDDLIGVKNAARVLNPVVDFDALPADADWWNVDAMICTLGTTIRRAGSKEAFRKVDFGYTLAVAELARRHGVGTFVLVSSVGADERSRYFYLKTKGEIERAVGSCGFSSLTIVRPASLDGARTESRPMEKFSLGLLRLAKLITPRRYRPVQADRVAGRLLACACVARPGVDVIESEAI